MTVPTWCESALTLTGSFHWATSGHHGAAFVPPQWAGGSGDRAPARDRPQDLRRFCPTNAH